MNVWPDENWIDASEKQPEQPGRYNVIVDGPGRGVRWATKMHYDPATGWNGETPFIKVFNWLPVARIIEILGPDNTVHYTRPEGHPDLAEAARTPGYWMRYEDNGDVYQTGNTAP